MFKLQNTDLWPGGRFRPSIHATSSSAIGNAIDTDAEGQAILAQGPKDLDVLPLFSLYMYQ